MAACVPSFIVQAGKILKVLSSEIDPAKIGLTQ